MLTPHIAIEIDVSQAVAQLHGMAERVGGGLGPDWAGPAVSAEIAAIERDWFESEGNHTWAPLSPFTVNLREKRLRYYARPPAKGVGSAHPILQWSGDLKESLADPRGRGRAHAVIRMSPTLLEQGTTLPYAATLQMGAPPHLPARPLFASGPDVEKRIVAAWQRYVDGSDDGAEARA